MPDQLSRVARPQAEAARDALRRIKRRLESLENETSARDWRRLHDELLVVLVDAQRTFVAIHREILAELRADLTPDRGQCDASQRLFEVLRDLHAILRVVERRLDAIEH